ncbi:isoprenylcysteine carboxyl methyltransferase family protein [Texcoconibacillus texcoconensis]|uniref:Methyltransferase n=1 Tax=Texcoconibacillus texcoconensis TaxID=1095777 RepID=A0A840QMG8_9BACI|nr:isoprenylcysteine carboxylmethyltransferase family protein [Texcoconibacillus texcoconensis]MBB5172569.1 methyltransferase [Texcoconibacillus texcoconensis]
MMFAIVLILAVIILRVLEMRLAKRNERWLKARNAKEVGGGHYPWIVGLHVAFFVSLLFEVITRGGASWSVWTGGLFALFMIVQVLRAWTLSTLGRYWNTKIFVIPQENRVRQGPYRWFNHPNYVVVALEILLLPLIVGAVWTAVVFTILNAYMILCVRLPTEEKALREIMEEREEPSSFSSYWLPD